MYVHRPLFIDSFSVPLCVPFSVNEPSKRPSIIIEDAGWQGDDGRVMAVYGPVWWTFDTQEALYQIYSFLSNFSNPVSEFALTYLRGFGGVRLTTDIQRRGEEIFFLTRVLWKVIVITCTSGHELERFYCMPSKEVPIRQPQTSPPLFNSTLTIEEWNGRQRRHWEMLRCKALLRSKPPTSGGLIYDC